MTLVRASRQKTVTVDEVVLLPGDDAIVAPPWLPWRERIQPGDLGPGDLLPTEEDDPRLVGVPRGRRTTSDDEEGDTIAAVTDELGLSRPRVLSLEGASSRRSGGTTAATARPPSRSRPRHVRSCGFMVRAGRAALDPVRRVRQRLRQRRRPGRVLRPWLRRAQRGAAPQTEPSSAASRAGARHPHLGRPRAVLTRLGPGRRLSSGRPVARARPASLALRRRRR